MNAIWIDAEKHAYVDSVLAQSGRLGRSLRARLELSWQVDVVSAQTVPQHHPFDAGGVSNREKSIAGLVSCLCPLLSSQESVCLLYNESFKREDPVVADYAWPVFDGEDIYHVIPSCASQATIRRSMLEAETGVFLMGVVTQIGLRQVPPPRSLIGEDWMIGWVRNANHIFVEIYDGESYAMWPLKKRARDEENQNITTTHAND